MKLLKAMATVAGLTGLSRVAGFIRDIMTAAILGAGPVADAFFVALKLPNLFRRITAEGAFSVSFVPIYAGELEREGRESADQFARRAFSIMLFGLSAFICVAMIFMPAIITVIAPGFVNEEPAIVCVTAPCWGSDRFELAVILSRITFPYLLFMSLMSLLGGVMNAHERFAPFAVAPVLFNLSLIAMLLMHEQFATAGHAMAWGVLLAGVLQFGLLYITARRWIGFKVKIVKPEITPRIKKLFKLMLPGMIGAGIVQINLFVDLIIASFLPTGSISYLYYADRLYQLPLSIVGIAVGTALLPLLSKAVAAKNTGEARHLFNRSLEVTLLLGVPAALALFVIAEPIIKILFERGAFTAEDTAVTVNVLRGYAIGLPAYIAVKVFATAFWSREDTVTPVKASIIVTLSNIALAVVLIQFIGVAGIALATGAVGWLNALLLVRKLKGQESARLDERFKKVLPRAILSACLMAAALYMVAPMLPGVIGLCVLVLGGMAIYGGAVILSGAVDKNELKKVLRRS